MMGGSLVRLCTFLVLLGEYGKANSQDTCGVVGHSDQTERSRLTDLRFYLNTQNPAPCSGNVTVWEYCYYSPDVTAGEYRAPFGIYRLNGTNYELVSAMFLIVISDDDIGSSSFTCRTLTTPVITIQQGDVVGTCVHDVIRGTLGRARAHLNLAGGSANGYSVQFADTSNSRCNTGLLESIPNSVSQGDLSLLSSTILHLHAQANIRSQPTTTTETSTTSNTRTEATTSTPTTMTVTTTTVGTTVFTTESSLITEHPTTDLHSTTVTRTTTLAPSTTDAVTVVTSDGTTTESSLTNTDTTAEQFETTLLSDLQNTTSEQPVTSQTVEATTLAAAVPDVVTIIAGAVVGGFVTVIVICSLLITVTVLVFKRRKHSESVSLQTHPSTSQTKSAAQIEMKENEAYTTAKSNISTISNEAYGCTPNTSSISTEQNVAYTLSTAVTNSYQLADSDAGADVYDYVDVSREVVVDTRKKGARTQSGNYYI